MSNAPAPGSPEWLRLMTASKVAAVLGLSPWDSPRSLWHTMRGDVANFTGNDATRRGHYLEAGVLAWWSDRHPDVVYPTPQAFLMREGWAASTPDLFVSDDGFGNAAVIDAKTAASDEGWGQPGTDEIPPHYLAQMLWQMWTHDAQVGYVAVLFGTRLRFEEYVVQRDDELIEGIVSKCREFYDSLTSDTPPPLDDHVATYEALRKLHPDIDADATVDLTEDEARAFTLSKGQLDTWEAEHRAAKSVVLERMGRARLAKFNGQTVARRQPNKYGVSLVAVAKTIPTETEDAA